MSQEGRKDITNTTVTTNSMAAVLMLAYSARSIMAVDIFSVCALRRTVSVAVPLRCVSWVSSATVSGQLVLV
ncbi:hypothetical protein BgiMline_028940 [Biomphalaria glabrata]